MPRATPHCRRRRPPTHGSCRRLGRGSATPGIPSRDACGGPLEARPARAVAAPGRRGAALRAKPSVRARVCSRITPASAAIGASGADLRVRQPLEQRQPVGDEHATRGRRRVREHLVAAEAARHRASPDHPVGAEIVGASGCRPPPVPSRRSLRASSPRYRHSRALRRDLLERLAEIGEAEHVAGRQA